MVEGMDGWTGEEKMERRDSGEEGKSGELTWSKTEREVHHVRAARPEQLFIMISFGSMTKSGAYHNRGWFYATTDIAGRNHRRACVS